ncbi:hypothetical protein CAPTEDRAFT_114616, partial [Capitella teleta]
MFTQIALFLGYRFRLSTPDDLDDLAYGYYEVTPSKGHFLFSASACNDIHLALAEEPGVYSANAYEIVIGGWENTQSVDLVSDDHLPQTPDQATLETPSILDCAEVRQFWVQWDDGLITVGDGFDVGFSPLLSWQDDDAHDVNYVTLSTGWGAEGEWRIEE